MRPGRSVLYLAAALSLVAALMHFIAAPDHFGEWWGYGTFMLVVALAQAIFGIALPWIARSSFSEPIRMIAIVGNLAIIAMYVVTRTAGVPFFGPEAGEVEPIGEMGGIDIISTIAEIVLVATLIALRPARVRAREVNA